MSSSDKKIKENKYPHQGHRQRMRKRFENEHETMTDVDIVEMLLYYAVPRADTRKQAQALVDVFGSLEGIIAADFGEVSKISGLKDSAETLFSLLRETIKRSGVKSASHSVLEPEKLKKYLVGLYKGASAETVYALYFSADGELVGKQLVFRGDVSSARFSLRTITEGVIRAGGNSVVLAHNHPSGSLVPSGDDLITTKRIAAHLAANDITLIEHYIVGNDDCAGILKVN